MREGQREARGGMPAQLYIMVHLGMRKLQLQGQREARQLTGY